MKPSHAPDLSFVVVVWFESLPARASDFERAVLDNARTSRAVERGCLQFDVCRDYLQPQRIFLYEVYRSRVDFELHLTSPHFQEFSALTAAWTVSKEVLALDRLEPLGRLRQ